MTKAPITELESAARLAMAAEWKDSDPLPPAPNYGPFGYFRLAILLMAILAAILLILKAV